MPSTCPSCLAPADDASANFCEACGAPMSGARAPAAKPAAGCPFCASSPLRVDPEGFCQDCGRRPSSAPAQGAPSSAPESATDGGSGWQSDPKLAHFTHVGRRHHLNQDAAAACRVRAPGPSGDLALMAVSDGVSSCQRGEDASAAAVDAWLRAARAACESGAPLPDAMREGFLAAQAAATALPYDESSGVDEPEATLVAAIVQRGPGTGSNACVGWVGDSRAYVVDGRSGTGRLATRDDSWLAEAIDAGMDEDQANADPRAHAITQCLGTRDEDPVAHVETFPLSDSECLLLCSDGLWNYCPDASDIAVSLLAHPADALAACRDLCGRANLAGGRDNVTVAILRP